MAFVRQAAGVYGPVPLADRPEGWRLLETIGKGDIVITAELDRMFRSANDALGTPEELKDQSVALHMIDLGGDVTGNGISKMVFTILAAVAEGSVIASAMPSVIWPRKASSAAAGGHLASISWRTVTCSVWCRTPLSRP